MAIPVVLDTDIGFDVDDVWALAFLLQCPELDLKLVVSSTGDTEYSARLTAKFLHAVGRTDVPVGVGIPLDPVGRTHAAWLGDYQLSDYPGIVITDGVGGIIDAVTQSEDEVAIVSIGPLANIAATLVRAPQVTQNSRFIGMHGSLRRGYLGAPKPMKEYNVKIHTAACQQVFRTPWNISITPLDTCGLVSLQGADFAAVRDADGPLARAVLENHYGWFEAVKDWPVLGSMNPQERSSILYDTVAVYMAFSEELLDMESLPVLVTDDAKTIIDERGQVIRCATGWNDRGAFETLVAQRLAG